jgi:integrase/recombinase XerD
MTRTNPQKKAKELAKLLRNERPDYHYLKAVFKHLRTELNVPVVTKAKSLSDIPTEDEMKQYYEIVWTGKNTQDLLIVKTSLSNLVHTCLLFRPAMRNSVSRPGHFSPSPSQNRT